MSSDPGAELILASSGTIIDSGTGEVLSLDDLGRYEPELIAEALLLVREHKTEVERVRKALDEELTRRAAEHCAYGKVWFVGDFELTVDNARVWDVDELEGVLGELVEDGVISASTAGDVVTRVPKVNGTNAARLLKRLSGEALAAVRACHTWKAKGLTVARSQPLLPED